MHIAGLLSGAVSRASTELLLHPIDTIRARQQQPATASSGNEADAATDGSMSVLDTIKDLYSGVGPALVGGIPAGAIFFGVKDFTKERLRSMGFSKTDATILSGTIVYFKFKMYIMEQRHQIIILFLKYVLCSMYVS